MQTPKPVKAIRIIAWLRIVIAVLVVALFIDAADDARPHDGVLSGVRAGFLQGAGYANPAQFTAEDAGRASFRPIMTVILSGLLLFFLHRRRLVAARVAEGAFLVLALPSLAMVLSVAVLILLFSGSVARYYHSPGDSVPATPTPSEP